MANPVTVKFRLDTLASHYAVFEPDQVLTHHQLNSVADYLDDQVALTRVDGLGVGIVAGLHVAARGATLLLGRGLGLTTDGDLLRLPADVVYDQFRPYDSTAPRYAPFYGGLNGSLFDMAELVPKGESDVLARPLYELTTWHSRVVVMLAECAENDPDLCTGADCDNLGRDTLLRQRVLLMKPDDAKAMLSALPMLSSPSDRALQLPRVIASRLVLGPDLGNTKDLTERLRNAAKATVSELIKALIVVPRVLADVTQELFGDDPLSNWLQALEKNADEAAKSPAAALAWYHASKDMAETWNAMREALFDDDSVAVPDLGAFRKHLLLGVPSAPRVLRTGLYPSPLVAGTRQQLAHAKFLLWKLHVLLNTFSVPLETRIAVTPSFGEAVSLEERSIPWYYKLSEDLPIHIAWNYKRAARDVSGALSRAENRGYRAGQVGWPISTSQLAGQLPGQLAQHDFFRIEGHMGRPIEDAIKELNNLIATNNLPIAIRTVLLDKERSSIRVRAPFLYSDLHRFHLLLRKDLQNELARSQAFSAKLKEEVERATFAGEIPERVAGGENATVANQMHQDLKVSIEKGLKAFSPASYRAFRQGEGWKFDLKAAADYAANFKQSFGSVLRTDVATAFDHLVNNPRGQWLDWLDVLIDRKEEKADDRMRFDTFVRRHPGLDALGGTWRGGTVVLVYDKTGSVVADLALPYRLVDEDEGDEGDDEPELKLPQPAQGIASGVRLVKPLDMLTSVITKDLRKQMLDDADLQRDLSKSYIDTILRFGEAFGISKNLSVMPEVVADFRDKSLENFAHLTDFQKKQIENLREKALNSAASQAERTAILKQIQETESALAKTVDEGMRYIVGSKVPLGANSEGAKVLALMTQSASTINDTGVRKQMGSRLAELETTVRGNDSVPQAEALARFRLVVGFGG